MKRNDRTGRGGKRSPSTSRRSSSRSGDGKEARRRESAAPSNDLRRPRGAARRAGESSAEKARGRSIEAPESNEELTLRSQGGVPGTAPRSAGRTTAGLDSPEPAVRTQSPTGTGGAGPFDRAAAPSTAIGNAKADDLGLFTEEPAGKTLTTNQGVRINNDFDTLKAGARGPALLEDFHFREKITHFDHERIPERVVHARGAGAHGYFECTKPMGAWTRADLIEFLKRATGQ